MKYTLMSDGEHSVIFAETDKVPAEFTPRATPIEAPSWLAAKKVFGFDLTETQAKMLQSQEEAA